MRVINVVGMYVNFNTNFIIGRWGGGPERQSCVKLVSLSLLTRMFPADNNQLGANLIQLALIHWL